MQQNNLKQRLEALKYKINKQDRENKKYGERSDAFKIMTDLAAGLGVGCLIGYWLDSYFCSLPIFLFVCTILGTAGGFYNFYKYHIKGLDKSWSNNKGDTDDNTTNNIKDTNGKN